jgi:hypothetical protein
MRDLMFHVNFQAISITVSTPGLTQPCSLSRVWLSIGLNFYHSWKEQQNITINCTYWKEGQLNKHSSFHRLYLIHIFGFSRVVCWRCSNVSAYTVAAIFRVHEVKEGCGLIYYNKGGWGWRGWWHLIVRSHGPMYVSQWEWGAWHYPIV